MKNAYDQAAVSGRYAVNTGLIGKYDNVRTYWEERHLCKVLAPYLDRLVQDCRKQERRFRIIDLGCGSGDGLAMLEAINDPDTALAEATHKIIDTANLTYKGVDLNQVLLEQGRERFPETESHTFSIADLSKGLPVDDQEKAYDLYFSSFGTFSHLDTEATVRLISEAAEHARDGSVLMADWLGRFSYEWQNEWDTGLEKEKWLDYRISYIYSEEERKTREIDSFPLRLVSPDEVKKVVSKAAEKAGVSISIESFTDRSVLSGRHIDTGEYNGNPMPIREMINRLHSTGHRTDLDKLRFNYRPSSKDEKLDDFFKNLEESWNTLLDYTADLFVRMDRGEKPSPDEIKDSTGPEPLKDAMKKMAESARCASVYQGEDIRAGFLEPQLGYLLRELETSFPEALGAGHGLVGILRINKT